MAIVTKRVYLDSAPGDGVRVLIDRLWPRGLTKEKAAIELWLREAAPSNELRKWYGHEPEKWPEFKRRYFAELDARADVLEPLAEFEGRHVTLVFSSREEHLNNATALKEYLERPARRRHA